MKKSTKLFTVFAFAMTLCSCGSGSKNSYQPGDVIYENQLVYDTSVEEVYDVFYKLSSTASVKEVSFGRSKSEKGEITVKNQILTLSKEFLTRIEIKKYPGDNRKFIVTYTDGKTETIPAFIATRIIKTAQEFQDINNDLQGFYMLGNDIDLSSISNFEPLGRFGTSEQDPTNEYFHGVLDGNGYTVKNAKVHYSTDSTSNTPTAQDVYFTGGLFKDSAHQSGNNIGLFQIIGSSGIVRNTRFDNIDVYGRTIVGVLAGNVSGLIENCIITETCKARMSTHYYDNDCNIGGVAGIVAGSGQIINTICLTKNITVPNTFTDYNDDYIGKTGNGWDHAASGDAINNPTWQFANVYRPAMNYSDPDNPVSIQGQNEIDSNGVASNGVYAFAGKTWGTIQSCYSLAFNRQIYGDATNSYFADTCFTQTHLGSVKPSSGDTDLGQVIDSDVKTLDELKQASLYASFDSNIWNIQEGQLPTLKYPLTTSFIAE